MGEGKEFREMAGCFQKCADSMNKVADILESAELDDKQKEEQMEEEMARFILHLMKMEQMKAKL